FRLARAVRFHWRAEGGAWRTARVELDSQGARVNVEGEAVEWWAEVLGEHDSQLATVASADLPIAERAPAPTSFEASPEEQPHPLLPKPKSERPAAMAVATAAEPPASSPLRTASWFA